MHVDYYETADERRKNEINNSYESYGYIFLNH